jgi:sec-independent protein translocase protein TatB
VFGLSFSEILVIGVVALVAVGPQKLPGMLRTLGEWVRKLRNLTHEVRAQSGIDEILRSEGLHGGLTELRSLMRGQPAPVYVPPPPPVASPEPIEPPRYEDPYAALEIDPTREYPPEGPDAYGALPDDLVDATEEHGLLRPQTLAGLEPPLVEAAPVETAPVETAPVETGSAHREEGDGAMRNPLPPSASS